MGCLHYFGPLSPPSSQGNQGKLHNLSLLSFLTCRMGRQVAHIKKDNIFSAEQYVFAPKSAKCKPKIWANLRSYKLIQSPVLA